MSVSPSLGTLVVTDLRKRFGSTEAISGLSFTARPGEILGLLGPNGAGKTTALMCLGGLLRPEGGTITLDGIELGAERGRKIILVAETPEVFPMLTVYEHMVFVARGCGLGSRWKATAEALLARFGLDDRRDSLGNDLSKGLRQKTLIAAAVLAESPVLALDEPMIGLDPAGQRELQRLLAELRSEGRTVILSTHLIQSAQAICDRVVILKQGVGIAEGSFEELSIGRDPARTLEDLFLDITQ